MLQDVSAIAPRLSLAAEGEWHSPSVGRVDYPDQANAFCFGIEETSFWFRHRNLVITDVVRRFPPAGFIADVGAGNGFVSLGLKQAGYETLVIEPGPAGIRNARTRGLSPLVRATLEDAGFLPGSLPAAGLFDVLEHIKDDAGVLRLLHSLIVPGGRLYVSVPAYNALWSTEDELVGHHRRYTASSLAARLREAGFDPEFGTYFFAPFPLPILLLRSIPSRLGYRPEITAERATSELQPHDSLAVRALDRLLAMERSAIRRGLRLPMGSSCLVVARA